MNNVRIAYWLRLIWAPLIIGLEFTNLFTVVAAGGKTHLADPRSPYLLEIATYIICAMVLALEPSNATRLVRKRLFRWSFAVIALFTWGMLVRTFYATAGIPSYDSPTGHPDYQMLRTFGLQVHAIGFMLAAVVIFDHPKVLDLVKRCIALATLLGVALNIYEVFHPGTFSEIVGRAAGLYVNSNDSGMALVLGCLVGLTTIRSRWREMFLLLTAVGVIVTFSREAILALGIVVAGATLGRAVSLHRLVAGGALVCALLSALKLGNSLMGLESWNAANLDRLSFATGDASAEDRLRLDHKLLEEFETAPLLGHGFGTDDYWGDIQSHDFFLNMLADYGIFGVFLIPTLLLSVRRKSWDSNVFGLVFLTWSFFMHMILVLPFSLIIIAVEAVEPAQSRRLPASASLRLVRRYSLA